MEARFLYKEAKSTADFTEMQLFGCCCFTGYDLVEPYFPFIKASGAGFNLTCIIRRT